MQRASWWPEVTGLAEDQAGLFTAGQARLAGASRPQLLELVNDGTIERVQHGVYRLGGAPADRWSSIRAAWLAIAPERSAADRLRSSDPVGVVSHRTAALVLDLGDVDADRIEIAVSERTQTRNPDVKFHRASLNLSDWTVHDGLPVTTPVATIRMLAAGDLDQGHLAQITRDAVLRYDIPVADLACAVEPAAGRYGFPDGESLVRALLETAGTPRSAVDLASIAAAAQLRTALNDSLPKLNLVMPKLDLPPEMLNILNAAVQQQLDKLRPTLENWQTVLPHLRFPTIVDSGLPDATRAATDPQLTIAAEDATGGQRPQ